jgi:hypothetical protein
MCVVWIFDHPEAAPGWVLFIFYHFPMRRGKCCSSRANFFMEGTTETPVDWKAVGFDTGRRSVDRIGGLIFWGGNRVAPKEYPILSDDKSKILVTGNARHYPEKTRGAVRILSPQEAFKLVF